MAMSPPFFFLVSCLFALSEDPLWKKLPKRRTENEKHITESVPELVKGAKCMQLYDNSEVCLYVCLPETEIRLFCMPYE